MKSDIITIVDYGLGNVGSILNMIRKIGGIAEISGDPNKIRNASKLILPGVGSFDQGIRNLERKGIIPTLNSMVQKVPILGICLGAQLMTKSSEEGTLPGLGWFDAEVKKFSFPSEQSNLRIPHMGWNYVAIKKESPLTNDLPFEPKFYFVHSYYMQANNPDDIMLTTNYGENFVSALNHNNMYAVQFHPEKSHKYGLKIFQNFLSI